MGELGRVFILGMFVRLASDGRPILLPVFAVMAAVLLFRLGPYRALSASRWFLVTQVCAVTAAVASAASWLPSILVGAALVVVGAATFLGPAAYAGVLHDWSVAQGWALPPPRRGGPSSGSSPSRPCWSSA